MRTILLAFFLCLFSLATAETIFENQLINTTHSVDFANEGNILIDLRTLVEYEEGHVPYAINIDSQSPNFEAQIAKLDKAKTYYVYCRSGNRSARALPFFEKAQFNKIIHLTDGFIGYQEHRQSMP